MINIGTIEHRNVGHVTLEISNNEEFIQRIKEINEQIPGTRKEKMKLWKIRVIGADKIPPKIQHLIDDTHQDEGSTESQQKSADSPPQNFGDAAMHASAAPEAMHASSEPPAKPKRKAVRRGR